MKNENENENENRKLFGTLPLTPAMITKNLSFFLFHFIFFCSCVLYSCCDVLPSCYVTHRDCNNTALFGGVI